LFPADAYLLLARRQLRAVSQTDRVGAVVTKHGSGLGKTRWVVERTIAWLHWFRRLMIRCERLPGIDEAVLTIRRSLICRRHLLQSQPSS
jgi:transposase